MLELWHVTQLKSSTFVYFGAGAVMFVLIVSLPFYVIVTSLKSQQSLMINPLDFSIDYGLGVEKYYAHI